MNNYIIKVCGMRDGENIRQVAALGVDWIGLVFLAPSSRNVTMIPTYAGIIPDRGSLSALAPLPHPTGHIPAEKTSPQRVGVFIDEMPQNIITHVVNFQLDLIQFNGHESPTLIRNLRHTLDPDIRPGIKVIKAIPVASPDDLAACKSYADSVDYFLFCGGNDSDSGGSFDWDILDTYDGTVPFLLSGDIGPNDAERLRAFHHPRFVGIDLNSRFETEPGIKDVEALRRFIEAHPGPPKGRGNEERL